jgi:exonuclease SbcC
VLIQRIYLRNYRVFEDELDLELPPGLVGIYGPNGAGKSTLLESMLWALWGKARTSKEEVPTAGSRGECIAEVTFEHEGHLYLVRRRISGANATVQAQVHCDRLAVAEGVRDAGRYLHSVLGMDDAAFRASVFAEQKQLAAFSDHSPADRRKLVLSLLGVTPLDGARDRARADARERAEQYEKLRAMLPDLQEAEVAACDAEAHAGAADAERQEEERAADAARDRAAKAKESFSKLDLLRQEHDILVVEGKSARADLDAAQQEASRLAAEVAGLDEAEAKLGEILPLVASLCESEQRVQLLQGAAGAAGELLSLVESREPPAPDEEGLASASEEAMEAKALLGAAAAKQQAAAGAVEQAKYALEQAATLSGREECPLCGQALGDAFAQVQAHRAGDLEAAQASLALAEVQLAEASGRARHAEQQLRRATREVEAARKARASWEQAAVKRAGVAARLDAAMASLAGADPPLAAELGPSPTPEALAGALAGAASQLESSKKANEEANRLRGRLERRPEAERALLAARERAEASAALVETLRAKVKALRFDPEALAAASASSRQAEALANEAEARAGQARVAAATARATADAAAKRLAEARAQHDRLASLQVDAVHLRRTAELLNAFRNSVVATVGPRLSVQAAHLFAELTDNEYDRLEVDPETYGLQISDGGVSYDLDRFSGSEVDLANLALRVAISEHVRFQSGGSVGLLVLDEVFGPLDEERRTRMLLALDRLRARFRQVLVVTHSTDVKDQLPNAIEVQKKPGRRASASLVSPGG